MRRLMTALLGLLLAAPALAHTTKSQTTPAIDIASWKGLQAGAPTQVMTLGSMHLAQLDKPVTTEMLAPLLDKLAAFKPDVITVEGISGEQCDLLRRYPARYAGMFETYCWPLDDAAKATGLDLAAAMAEVDKTLANWPAAPTAAQRRHLAAVFIAAGDRASAREQWLQLAPAERTTGDGVDAALLAILTPTVGKSNESYAIAAALAARLGLQRVFPVDDHTADAVQAEGGPGFDPYMESFWKGSQSALVDAVRQREAGLQSGADVLTYYRLLNQPETLRAFVEVDHKRAMQTPSPQNYGRMYFAWWETRNLRMVSNIRAAFAAHPGARVLNVVGASHKPFYDAYLALMGDVALVDTEAVLR